ncbi:MAG TPA: hypothetical protein P5064_06635 [Clostridia bacterium]|mgnify:CR=1 FL=1|jgi:hypothetical protein|nr:hypothetical protein [Clostridiaceae bacterium]HOF26299.1 hypothetical protein [Clostridia bacterium]HOM35244.1 hypothetical protein [Clostridia bacterium]HOR89525.1 hypothetical protein [Clostridia bacterium]HOT70068.1 hypothetical protein [Clostridia bacterium]
MDLSTLIKYLRKNIVLIVIVVLCCAILASVFKIITNYSNYRKEEENIQVLQTELDSLVARKDKLLKNKADYEKNELYMYIKPINSSSLKKYTAVYNIEKNVALLIAVVSDESLLTEVYKESGISVPFKVVDIFVDFTATVSYNTLTMHVYAKGADDLVMLKGIANKCFERAISTVNSTLGTGNITLLYETENLSGNTALADIQKTYNTSYTDIQKAISEADKQIAEKQTVIDEFNYDSYNKDVFLYTLLGIVLGMFLAYVLIVARLQLSSKLIDIEQIPGLNLFSVGKDINIIAEQALVPVIHACGKTTDPIGITGSENIEAVDIIAKYLKDNTDYDWRLLNNFFDSVDIAKSFLDCSGIILVEKYRSSQVKKVNRILEVCKNNNITVYGVIIVE